jgi:hypothetical protein
MEHHDVLRRNLHQYGPTRIKIIPPAEML